MVPSRVPKRFRVLQHHVRDGSSGESYLYSTIQAIFCFWFSLSELNSVSVIEKKRSLTWVPNLKACFFIWTLTIASSMGFPKASWTVRVRSDLRWERSCPLSSQLIPKLATSNQQSSLQASFLFNIFSLSIGEGGRVLTFQKPLKQFAYPRITKVILVSQYFLENSQCHPHLLSVTNPYPNSLFDNKPTLRLPSDSICMIILARVTKSQASKAFVCEMSQQR